MCSAPAPISGDDGADVFVGLVDKDGVRGLAVILAAVEIPSGVFALVLCFDGRRENGERLELPSGMFVGLIGEAMGSDL